MIAPSVAPPPGLEADEANGVYVVLALPYGEPCNGLHEQAGQVFAPGQVGAPDEQAHVDVDHNRLHKVGRIVKAVENADGWWCSVFLDANGRELVDAGYTRVSAELRAGRLVGVALVSPGETPGFASAGIVGTVPLGQVFQPEPVSWLEALARQADTQGGVVVVNGAKAPPPVAAVRFEPDVGKETREFYAQSMTAVEDDVRHQRRRFEERRAAYAAQEAEREEQALMAAGVPMFAWPEHTAGRQQYEESMRQQAGQMRISASPVIDPANRTAGDEAGIYNEPETHEERATWWSKVRARIFR